MNQTCTNCGSDFQITDEDLAFYDSVSPVINGQKFLVPSPLQCPDCRYQNRLTWRNERWMYKRNCDATGKSVVSIFSADKTWPPVYKQDFWWSDKWNARDYGRDFDFNRPFFEQWLELFKVVPQAALNNQQSENCEYTNQSQRNKDSYMIFCSNMSENCMHSMWLQKSRDTMDCLYTAEGELAYDILNGDVCYRCSSSSNLKNCSDVHFSRDLIGCSNCFGCMNLRNKQYHIFNEPHSKEDYEQKIAELNLHSRSGRLMAKKYADEFTAEVIHKYYTGSNIEASSGDYIMDVTSTRDCFNCRDTEATAYCQDFWRGHHCQDLTEVADAEFCYQVEGSAPGNQVLFSKKFCNLTNSMYSSHCNSSSNLFGCISLNNGEYCILNKQYTREEYEALVPRIIEHMQSTGEWGQYFPATGTPFCYNETVAQEYFPLSKQQALDAGYCWQTHMPNTTGKQTIEWSDVPDSIADITDDITKEILSCTCCSKNYRIIPQELILYKQMHIPVPDVCADWRHVSRMNRRNPRKLFTFQCAKCSKDIETTYPQHSQEIVYCEECYLSAVY